jgi:hypothetical protein
VKVQEAEATGRCRHYTGERHTETESVKFKDVKICGEIMKTPEAEMTYKHQKRQKEVYGKSELHMYHQNYQRRE